MRRIILRAPLLALLPAAAGASPSFKQAPGGSDRSGAEDGGGFGFDFASQFGLAADEPMPPLLQLLGDYYGYLGVVFVLLVLFLFARGKGDEEAGAVTGGSDDDFFEPDDADRFGRGR